MVVSQNRGSRWGSEISDNHVTVLGRFMGCQMLLRVMCRSDCEREATVKRDHDSPRQADDAMTECASARAHDWRKLPLSIRNGYLLRVQDTARGGHSERCRSSGSLQGHVQSTFFAQRHGAKTCPAAARCALVGHDSLFWSHSPSLPFVPRLASGNRLQNISTPTPAFPPPKKVHPRASFLHPSRPSNPRVRSATNNRNPRALAPGHPNLTPCRL